MILVTGATGFLGRRVCKMLDEKKIEYRPTSLSLGVDFRNKDEVFNIFETVKPDYVLNCAAYVGGIQFGLKHQGELFTNNMLMTINLLEACKNYNVKRLVNPISNCAYPAKATLFKESEFWDGELHDSVMVYGFARKASWIGSLAYYRQYNLDSINIILSNMYGPEDHFEEERSHALGALVMKFVEAKRTSQPTICIWGTGNPVREWLYVDEGAEAMIRSMSIDSHQEPINIGVAKGISIKDMAYMIKEYVGYDGELEFDLSKPDGAKYKTVDGSKGEKLLGWKPKKDFSEGVKETIDWYIKNS